MATTTRRQLHLRLLLRSCLSERFERVGDLRVVSLFRSSLSPALEESGLGPCGKVNLKGVSQRNTAAKVEWEGVQVSKPALCAWLLQAIGRVRRYGQTRTVHLWRFLASATIDTEIYEQRVLGPNRA
eukprot:7366016-Pyramimonas_sp.AAC.1